jgi:hypothetical protein
VVQKETALNFPSFRNRAFPSVGNVCGGETSDLWLSRSEVELDTFYLAL